MAGLRDTAKRIGAAIGLKPLWHRVLERRAAAAAGDIPPTDEAGLPLPPALLMSTVVGHADWRMFLDEGCAAATAFRDAVDRNGGAFANARHVLDFGCGCGRLARHLPSLTKAALFGVDYNEALVSWCARNLKGAYSRNHLQPPLEFAAGHFDVIYLLSVFTHQRAATEEAWLQELARVLAPGGLLLATFHDEDHPGAALAGIARDDILSRGFIVHNDAAEGSNYMATFQSREDFRRRIAGRFEILELTDWDKSGLGQTLAVMRPTRSALA